MNNEAGPSNDFIELEPGSEWRFELEADENIAIRVSQKGLYRDPTIKVEPSHCAMVTCESICLLGITTALM